MKEEKEMMESRMSGKTMPPPTNPGRALLSPQHGLKSENFLEKSKYIQPILIKYLHLFYSIEYLPKRLKDWEKELFQLASPEIFKK